MSATKKDSKYDQFKRYELIAQLHYRDREIEKLRARTIDDYLRELIRETIDSHGVWFEQR